MNDLRVGGLVSGLDTNAIIESLMKTAKQPITRLNQQVQALNLEKRTYNGMITSLADIKSALLPLKLESTFKTKLTTSSNESVATAKSSIDTPPGTYNLLVEQLAQNSSIVASRPDITFFKGANVDKATMNDTYKNHLYGVHTVKISEEVNNKPVIATDVFVSNENREFGKYVAGNTTAPITSSGNYNGGMTATELKFKVGDKDVTVNLPANSKDPIFIQEIAKQIEEQLNSQLNAGSSSARQQVAVKTELDDNGNFRFAFYDTTDKNLNISLTSSNNSAVSDALGLTKAGATTITSVGKTKEIINQVMSDTLKNLTTKALDPSAGIIPGITFELLASTDPAKPTILSSGSFNVTYDDTMNKRVATKSTFIGNYVTGMQDANGQLIPTVSDAQIQEWLKTPMNQTNMKDVNNASNTIPSYFKNLTMNTGEFFHINGVKIKLEKNNYTPNELMGLINSSGAGVTALWDNDSKVFKLESNKTGTGDITIGRDGDTSNVLSHMALTIPEGAVYIRGTDAGSIDMNAKVENAGFSKSITSGIFTINGVSIYIDSTKDTVADVMGKINKSGANVTMTYDKTIDKFKLVSKTGTGRIEVGSKSDTSNFLFAIGVTDKDKETTSVGELGQKSKFKLNGISYEKEGNMISDVVTGMDISLISVGSTSFSVSVDTDRAISAMADFASNYNKLMEMLSPPAITKDDRDKYGQPLSDEDAKAMKDEDIKEYNKNYERIKNYDTVSRSSELRYLKNQVRSNLTKVMTETTSPIKSLLDVGLNIAGASTGDYTVTQLGFFIDVSTDKDVLKKKISDAGQFGAMVATDPDSMFKFFSETKAEPTGARPTGFASSYDKFATDSSNSSSVLYKKAGIGGVIDTQVLRLQDQIEVQTKRAEDYLERMWAEFAAMETRMQRIQDQSAALAKLGNNAG